MALEETREVLKIEAQFDGESLKQNSKTVGKDMERSLKGIEDAAKRAGKAVDDIGKNSKKIDLGLGTGKGGGDLSKIGSSIAKSMDKVAGSMQGVSVATLQTSKSVAALESSNIAVSSSLKKLIVDEDNFSRSITLHETLLRRIIPLMSKYGDITLKQAMAKEEGLLYGLPTGFDKQFSNMKLSEVEAHINKTTSRFRDILAGIKTNIDAATTASQNRTNALNQEAAATNRLEAATQRAQKAMKAMGWVGAASQVAQMGLGIVSQANPNFGKTPGAGMAAKSILGGMGGAMSGAMIGSMIAPGVGTAIGAAAGLLMSSATTYMTATNEFKQSVREAKANAQSSYEQQAKGVAQSADNRRWQSRMLGLSQNYADDPKTRAKVENEIAGLSKKQTDLEAQRRKIVEDTNKEIARWTQMSKTGADKEQVEKNTKIIYDAASKQLAALDEQLKLIPQRIKDLENVRAAGQAAIEGRNEAASSILGYTRGVRYNDERAKFMQALEKDLADDTNEELNGRVEALDKEKAATLEQIDALAELARKGEDVSKALEDFQTRLEEIESERGLVQEAISNLSNASSSKGENPFLSAITRIKETISSLTQKAAGWGSLMNNPATDTLNRIGGAYNLYNGINDSINKRVGQVVMILRSSLEIQRQQLEKTEQQSAAWA